MDVLEFESTGFYKYNFHRYFTGKLIVTLNNGRKVEYYHIKGVDCEKHELVKHLLKQTTLGNILLGD